MDRVGNHSLFTGANASVLNYSSQINSLRSEFVFPFFVLSLCGGGGGHLGGLGLEVGGFKCVG